MSISSRNGRRLNLAFTLLLAIALLQPAASALAQSSLLGEQAPSSETADGEALNKFLDEARKAGARVVVIDPSAVPEDAPAEAMSMASSLASPSLLEARWKFVAMVRRANDYLPRLYPDLVAMGDSGDLRWIGVALITAIGGLAAGSWVFRLVTRWGRVHFHAMYRPEDKRRSSKLAYLLARAGWMLLSIGIGFVTAILVAVIFDMGHEPTRKAIFAILSTYAGYRIMRSVVFWNFFLPDTPSHRLINLSDHAAKRLFRDWSMALGVVALIVAACRWVRNLNVDRDFDTLFQIVGLLVCALIFLGLAILHRRDLVATVLGAGNPEEKPVWRRIVAYGSVPITLAYIILAWFVSSVRLTLGVPGGYLPLAAPFIIFVAAIFAYAVSLLILDKLYERREASFLRRQQELAVAEQQAWERAQESARIAEQRTEAERDLLEEGEFMRAHVVEKPKPRTREYVPAFKPFFESAIQATILVVSLGELSRLWGADIGREGGHPIAATLDVVFVILVAISAYRAINHFIDLKISEEDGSAEEAGLPADTDNEGGTGRSRLATLLPILRNVLIALVAIVAVTAILSYVGVNVAPLFAGAGVVGIAIGFGAQTLIRDIFSGAFFLVDDAFRKGEYIEVGQVMGVVEKISVRSFQLRHHLGAVHTIPFGEIHQLTNYSRDWVIMKLPLRVTYDTDVEKVRKLIKKLGQQLLKDELLGPLFLQPLKSQGVYKMEDSAMIIRVKFMTRPGDQFVARKAVYAAIRDIFAREGITFAHREVTVRLADGVKASDLNEAQKEAIAGSVRATLKEEEVEASGLAAANVR